ncbi:MAG: carbon monoxide dehydrogenase, partial [Desulfobacterales bacterium]|nr:carbon monoxide dehydrogenase [Desulfobacterales bacterium]
MVEKKAPAAKKAPKLADPIEASVDKATQKMIVRSHELGVETIFDRAVNMKQCNIGIQGICCKNCAMGPCRLPLPKAGIEGEDTRKGLCGAPANTIAARNFIRMIAGGAAAHSDHGRTVAEVFLSVARGESTDYKIKDPIKLIQIAPSYGVETKVEVDGEMVDRELSEIALEVAEAAMAEWGKVGSHTLIPKHFPEARYERWKKLGVLPRNIDREIVDIMHRTHMGVDQDYKNLMKQGARAALADMSGSWIATDLQDVMFGTPSPLISEANLGVMKQDHVNIIVHGHEPVLSEMIVAAAQSTE